MCLRESERAQARDLSESSDAAPKLCAPRRAATNRVMLVERDGFSFGQAATPAHVSTFAVWEAIIMWGHRLVPAPLPNRQ